MSEAFTELEVLREATRPRLTKQAVLDLRDLAEGYDMGDAADRKLASALSLLLDMHDKLETIRHGHA